MKQDTLKSRIANRKELSESEIFNLVEIFGKYCQDRTKRILQSALQCVPDIPSYGIYDRVIITPRVQYCAGQSYPDEIRTVRKCLLEA